MTIAHATLLSALLAAVVNTFQALATGRYPSPFSNAWVIVHSLIAGISFFYVGAFAWLIWGKPDRAHWSEFLTPVSIISFIVVWSLPAVVHHIEDKARYHNGP